MKVYELKSKKTGMFHIVDEVTFNTLKLNGMLPRYTWQEMKPISPAKAPAITPAIKNVPKPNKK